MSREDRRLEAAVEQGIISVAQAAAIRALGDDASDDPSDDPSERARRRAPDRADGPLYRLGDRESAWRHS